MNKSFVDTNLFIRYLTNDDPEKANRFEKLLEQAASGILTLVTTEMVIAEIVWGLESFYELTPPKIAPLIRGILATPGLEIINGHLISRALELYEGQNIDFVDGYITAVMEKQGISDIYSFDRKHISRIRTVTRNEP
jgi:predicted nucleic-acid-binding protein